MAQKTVVVLEDDIDGGDAEETLSFALDGATYEIDLSEDNAAALRDAFAPWVGAARRAGRAKGSTGPGRRPRAARAAAKATDLGDVRSWGKANGFKVSERGRISGDLAQAYEAAH